jgi:hypothetical protein
MAVNKKKKTTKKKAAKKMTVIPITAKASQRPSELCPRFDIEALKFAVEIEWNNGHNVTRCFDSNYWVNHPEHCGMEIKSDRPFKGFHGLALVEKGCRKVKELTTKGIAFEDCGMHLHIDVSDIMSKPEAERTEVFRNVIYNVMAFERAIMFLQHSARIAICESRKYIRTLDFADMKKIKRATTSNQIISAFPDRYFGLNFHGLKERPALEFRYHRGTFNFEEIVFWLFVFAKLIHFAKHGVVIEKKSILGLGTHELAKEMVVELGLEDDAMLMHDVKSKKITRLTARDCADAVARLRLQYPIYDVTKVGPNFDYRTGKTFQF